MTLAHWPVSVALRARALGLIDRHASLVLGGPDADDTEASQATSDVAGLIQLMARLPERFFDGDFRRFALAQGFDEPQADMLTWGGAPRLAHHFARADLVRTARGFQLLELNIGGAVGGMAYGSMPMLTGLGPQQDAPLRAWAHYVSERVRGHGRGAIVEDALLLPTERPVLEINARALAECCGAPVDVVSQNDLQHVDGQLLANGRPVGWIYPIVSPRDVCNTLDSYQALRDAISQGSVALPFDMGTQALGSKLLLAGLWELLDAQRLSPDEGRLVRRLLPRTDRLSAGRIPSLLAQRAQWVLKPALDYGGHGVYIGSEMSDHAWADALARAANASEPHVVQHRCQPLAEDAVVGVPGGSVRRYPVHFVWGAYVADGRRCGEPVMRCRPTEGTLVINYANGAAAGMLRSGACLAT